MREVGASLIGCLVLSFLAGCGGQAFGSVFPEAAEPEFSRFIRNVNDAPERQEAPVVVGVGADGASLVAWDLAASRLLWRQEGVPLTSAPVVAGHLVIVQEGPAIVARRLADGETAFRIEEEASRLVGADGDGRHTAIAIAQGDERSPSGLLIIARGDDVLHTRELQLPVGVPAVTNGLVLVPWATQRLSVVDAEGGHERTRIRFRNSVVGQAFVADGGVFIGQHGVFRVTASIENGLREEALYYEPRARPLPGQPPLLRDGYEPVPAPDGAGHRVRVIWSPAMNGGEIATRDDNLYFLFYRLLFAFDPESDALRWVYVHPKDVVGAEAQAGGVLLADGDGELVRISASTGTATWSASMGAGLRVAALRPGAFAPAETPVEGELPNLGEQLYAASSLEDARLAGGRALAVRYLAEYEGADVTGQLVDLCADRQSPESVRLAACGAVTERTDGAEHVRAALLTRGSFLEDTTPPPVGALAQAAGKMGMRMLIPTLLEHLEDPSTPTRELPGLMQGLAQLGHRSAADPVERFLRLYHAESADPALVEAAGQAAHTLAALAGDGAEDTLVFVQNDELATPAVRDAARNALAALRAPPPEEPEEPEEPVEPEEPEEDSRFERITPQITAAVFRSVERNLQGCLPEGVPSARVSMLVEPSGEIGTVLVTPAAAQNCIRTIVRQRRFPETRLRSREQIVYTVRLPADD